MIKSILHVFFMMLFLNVSFFITEADASSWYVDNGATGNNNGTSWTDAWQRFQDISWTAIDPGDIVYISGGSSSKIYYEPLIIGKSGSSGNPIYIRSGQDSGHNGTVIFDGGGGTGAMINYGLNEYVIVNGQYNGSRHINVRNNLMSDDIALISSGGGGEGSEKPGIKLLWAEISNSGTGVRMLYHTDFEIANCYIHDISHEAAIDMDGSGGTWGSSSIHDNHIVVNTSADGGGSGPDGIQITDGVDIYHNLIEGINNGNISGNQHPDGIQVLASQVRIFGNEIRNFPNAQIMGTTGCEINELNCQDLYIYNNLFYTTRSGWTGFIKGVSLRANYGSYPDSVSNIRIYNNTFADFYNFNALRVYFDADVMVSDFVVANNIFYNSGGGGGYEAVYLGNANYSCGPWGSGASVVMDYNVVSAGNSGSSAMACDGSYYTQLNGQTGEVNFENYSVRGSLQDFHLTSNNDASIDKGIDLAAYIREDFDGVLRPQGLGWDIGAYEYHSMNSGDSIAPAPPTYLIIQ